jgi:hypothetical protein
MRIFSDEAKDKKFSWYSAETGRCFWRDVGAPAVVKDCFLAAFFGARAFFAAGLRAGVEGVSGGAAGLEA